jgi:hypothetical protein
LPIDFLFSIRDTTYGDLNREEWNKMNEGNKNNAGFSEQVRVRAQEKRDEYYKVLHEIERLSRSAESIKCYLDTLNSFLLGEGESPISVNEPKQSGSIVGRPGNRGKDFPLRKAEWTGMTLDAIIAKILEGTKTYHADDISRLVYDIQSDDDVRKVKRSLVSILRKGAGENLWEALGKNRYRGQLKEFDTK